MDTVETLLSRLQGVWFLTQITADGRLISTHQPSFPTGPDDPWLMTIRGASFHVTANASYYATGGRVRLIPESGRLTFINPSLPEEWDSHLIYRLVGDELLLCSGGFPWSGPHDVVSTTRYVRVAAEPTPEMVALIEEAMQHWGGVLGPLLDGSFSLLDEVLRAPVRCGMI